MKTIRLDGVVGLDILAEDVARQMEGQDSVKLILNSGGGDIIEGFSIYNAINDFAGETVAQIDFAGSMMSVIAMAADRRTMKDNSSLMMTHRPWGGIAGNSEDLRAHADNLDKLEAMLVNIYSGVSGMSREDTEDYLSEERYLNAEEAINYGLIDEVETGKSDLSLVAMAGMKAHEKVGFDMSKFCAKMEAMAKNKPPVKELFSQATTLAEVESVARKNLKLSRAETTAIVAAVKNVVHCDNVPSEKLDLTEMFNNFEIGTKNGTKSRATSGL